MMEWKQVVFGKRVQHLQGPIVQGTEHRCTGMSSSVPADILPLLSPSSIGPGITDLTNWSMYPWIDQGGGIAIQWVVSSQQVWIIACRACGRSEQGEHREGRLYTQAHYLIAPVQGFSPLHLPSLFSQLKAEPMTDQDMALSTISTKPKSQELPNDWIDRISPMLCAILSGEEFAISTAKLSMKQIENIGYWLMLSLPNSISWRLTMRLGADVFEEGDSIFSVAHKVMSGPRMIGYSWEEHANNKQSIRGLEHAQHHPIHGDRLLGSQYIDFLREKTSSCVRDVDVHTCIQECFAHMDWNYFPCDLKFTDVCRLFMRDVIERDLLKKFTAGISEIPDVQLFTIYKEEALRLALPHVLEHTASFVAQTISLWPDVWECISFEEYPICGLFIYKGVWTTPLLEQIAENVPNVFFPYVDQVLCRQLEEKENTEFWYLLMQCWSTVPHWFQHRVLAREELVFWRLVYDARVRNNFEMLTNLTMIPSGLMFVQCLNGAVLEKKKIQRWFEFALAREDLDWLFEEMMKRDVPTLCMLLSAVQKEVSMLSLFTFPKILSSTDRHEWVEHLLRDPQRYSIIGDRLLLVESLFCEESRCAQIKEILTERLDPVLGCVLWGQQTFGTYMESNVAQDLIWELISQGMDKDMCIRMEAEADEHVRSRARDFMLSYAKHHPSWNPTVPSIHIVHQLMHGFTEPLVDELNMNRLVFFIKGCPSKDWMRQLISLDTLHAWIVHALPRGEIHPDVYLKLLSQEGVQKDFWCSIIEKHELQDESCWRLVYTLFQGTSNLVHVYKDEDVLLQQLPSSMKVHLFCSGIIFDSLVSIEDVSLNKEQLIRGLWVSLHASSPQMQKILLCHALRSLREEGRYEQIQIQHTRRDLWAGLTRWYRVSFASKVPAQFPSYWDLGHACTIVLDHLTQSERAHLFTFE